MAIKKKANVACGCVRGANFLSLTRSTSVPVKYECHLNATPMGESRPISSSNKYSKRAEQSICSEEMMMGVFYEKII